MLRSIRNTVKGIITWALKKPSEQQKKGPPPLAKLMHSTRNGIIVANKILI